MHNLSVLFHLYIFFIILLVLVEINELFNVWHVQMFQRLIVTMKISHYVLCNVQIFVTRSLSILPLQDTGHLQQQFREAARLRRGCLMIHTHNYFLRPASAAGQPGTHIIQRSCHLILIIHLICHVFTLQRRRHDNLQLCTI